MLDGMIVMKLFWNAQEYFPEPKTHYNFYEVLVAKPKSNNLLSKL